ncbi:hypothetical protein OIE12_14765 [Streptomyces sp. NBC_00670]
MSAATFSPVSGQRASQAMVHGADRSRRRVSGVVRAVGVFAGAAFDVVVRGEYGEDEVGAGVRRRR